MGQLDAGSDAADGLPTLPMAVRRPGANNEGRWMSPTDDLVPTNSVTDSLVGRREGSFWLPAESSLSATELRYPLRSCLKRI